MAVHRAVGASRLKVVWDRFLETWILLAVAAVLGSCIGIGVQRAVTETWPGATREVAPALGAALIAGVALVTLTRGLTLSLQATPAGVLGERPSLADPSEGLAGRGLLVVAQLGVVTCLPHSTGGGPRGWWIEARAIPGPPCGLPLRRFGSGDCGCEGHLIHVPVRPDREVLRRADGAVGGRATIHRAASVELALW